ncbi:MAG TPA: MFS transporter [Roseomonas sp.]|nr:MFS transporter [Roseomonas sp.]
MSAPAPSRYAAAASSPASSRARLASLALAMLLASLGSSIANVGLPTLAQAFGASFQQVQWVILAYLLAITTLVVGAGRLGDIEGRRRLLLAGMALFTLGSLLAGLAPALGWLVAARAIQGSGAALMMGLTLSLVGDAVAKEKTGSAMGLLGSMSAIGTALGPSLGGWLIGGLGWRSSFLVLVPLGAATLAAAWRSLPADRPARREGAPAFDAAGMLLLAVTLGAYTLSMTVGRGAAGVLNLLLLVAAVVGLGALRAVERRSPAPLLPAAMLRDPALRAGLATTALTATVMMATLVIGPFYLSQGLGLDATWLGLAMSVGPMVAAACGVPSGRLVDRLGTRVTTLCGLGGMTAGAAGLALLPASLGIAGYVAPLMVATAGYALFQAANTTGVMREVPSDRRGVVSGLLTLARNLGFVTGASLMGTIFAHAGRPGAAPAEQALSGLQATFGVASVLLIAAIAIAARRQPARPTER